MKATVGIHNPDSMTINIHISMTVGEARRLRSQIGTAIEQGSVWQLHSVLSKSIEAAEKHFDATHEASP